MNENAFLDLLAKFLLAQNDIYKGTHPQMYPEGITNLYTYAECRAGAEVEEIPFVGFQAFLQKYFAGVQVTKEQVDALEAFMRRRLPPNSRGFDRTKLDYIVKKHGGRLPLSIMAAPEGLVIPKGNVVFTVEATDPKCYWLAPLLDSFAMHMFSPQGVAANAREMKKALWQALVQSGTATKEQLLGMLIDFGQRSSLDPALAGQGHLALFNSSDNMPAIIMAEQYYHGLEESHHGELASSVVASEHTVSLTWENAEEEMVRTWLRRFPDEPISIVLDTRDPYHFIDHVFRNLRDEILARPTHAPIIARPDSGVPEECLPKYFEGLFNVFGYRENAKHYGILPPQMRLLQGDAVSRAGLPTIIQALLNSKISFDNMLFGSGGALLTDLTRTKIDFVIKGSEMEINGRTVKMRKTPKGQSLKNSKEGRFWLDTSMGTPRTVPGGTRGCNNVLTQAFLNGDVPTDYHFREVRQRADIIYE